MVIEYFFNSNNPSLARHNDKNLIEKPKIRSVSQFKVDEKYPFPKTDTLVEVGREQMAGVGVGKNAKADVHADSDVLILNRVRSVYVPSLKYADPVEVNKGLHGPIQLANGANGITSGKEVKVELSSHKNQEVGFALMFRRVECFVITGKELCNVVEKQLETC